MKGDKAGGRGGARPLRLESQRFRLLSIVVGCFVICLVFLLSSRPDAAAAAAFGTGQCLTSSALSRAPSAGSSLFHARAVPLCSQPLTRYSTRVPILLLAVSVSPKASLVAARRPVAVKTVRASSSSSSSAAGALGTYTISRLARW